MMKIGAQDKKKVIIMVGLLVILIPLAIYNFGSVSGSSPAPPLVASPAPSPGGILSRSHVNQKKSSVPHERQNERQNPLDTSIHIGSLEASQKIEYTGENRNIFKMGAAPVKIDP